MKRVACSSDQLNMPSLYPSTFTMLLLWKLDKSLAKLLALSKFPSRELDFKSYRPLFSALAGCEFGL